MKEPSTPDLFRPHSLPDYPTIDELARLAVQLLGQNPEFDLRGAVDQASDLWVCSKMKVLSLQAESDDTLREWGQIDEFHLLPSQAQEEVENAGKVKDVASAIWGVGLKECKRRLRRVCSVGIRGFSSDELSHDAPIVAAGPLHLAFELLGFWKDRPDLGDPVALDKIRIELFSATTVDASKRAILLVDFVADWLKTTGECITKPDARKTAEGLIKDWSKHGLEKKSFLELQGHFPAWWKGLVDKQREKNLPD